MVTITRGRVLHLVIERATVRQALDAGHAGGDHVVTDVDNLDMVDSHALHDYLAAVETMDVDDITV